MEGQEVPKPKPPIEKPVKVEKPKEDKKPVDKNPKNGGDKGNDGFVWSQ